MKFRIFLVLMMAIVFGLTMGPPASGSSILSPINNEAMIMTVYPVNIGSATISTISDISVDAISGTMVSIASTIKTVKGAKNSANAMLASVQNMAENSMAFSLIMTTAPIDGTYKTIAVADKNDITLMNAGVATTTMKKGAFLTTVDGYLSNSVNLVKGYFGDSATATWIMNGYVSTIQPAFTDLSSALASNIDIGTDNLEAVALTSLGGNMILKKPIFASVDASYIAFTASAPVTSVLYHYRA